MSFSIAHSFSQVKVAPDADLATPAHPSAILEVYSLDQGFLPPRMTETQRNTITAPAEGLMVFNTTDNCLNEFMSGVWKTYCDIRFSTVCNCVEYLQDNGLATEVWIPIADDAWRTLGNTGTNPITNFLGTIDNQPLSVRANNIQKWRFETNGTLNFTNTGNSVFIGTSSGISDLQTNNQNTFVGFETGQSNTSGKYNTAIGTAALKANISGWRNTAVGGNSLLSNTTGYYNTAIGFDAHRANLSGTYNVAIGNNSMITSTSGTDNVAVGAQSMANLGSGNYNVAIGRSAVAGNLSGPAASFTNVVGIGYLTFADKTSGNFSVAIGTRACDHETIGAYNVGVGAYSFYNNYTGSNNTALGFFSGGFPTSTSNFSNTTALGYGSAINASNKVRIGNASVTVVEGQVAYSWPSDARFKSNIKENVPGLDFIMGLRPVTYNFDTRKFDEFLYQEVPDSIKAIVLNNHDYTESESIIHTGFVAQEIEELVDELDYDFDGLHIPTNQNENYSVSYSTFVVPLVKAMQEQQVIIDQLKQSEAASQSKVEKVEQQLSDYQKQMELLMKEIEILKKAASE